MTWALPPRYVIDGRYEIVKVLGQGSFGITYKARTADGGLVAIKEYFPQDAAIREGDGRVVLVDEQKREIFDWGYQKFEEERRVLERISHPNVVRLVDHVEGNATRYLVFEFIDGQTLQHRIRTQARMWPDDLREFIGPILDGIEEVHRAGWVHKDIKPDNLMVEDGTNRPVLIDFGLARRPGEGRLETMPAGGFNYMAKEQLSEDVTKLGPWTDIFGLGGVCYFALFGRPPQSSTLRMAEDGYEPAETLGAQLNDPALMHAIDKALALEPKDRFQSIAAFREAVQTRSVGAAALVRPVDSKLADQTVVRRKAAVVERAGADPMAAYATPTPVPDAAKRSSGPPVWLWLGGAAVAIGTVVAAALLIPREAETASSETPTVATAADPAEEAAWINARQSDTAAAYRAFAAAYPNSVHAAEAVWKATPEVRADLEDFLRKFPNAPQAEDARKALQVIEAQELEQDNADWQLAVDVGTPDAYQRYLERHPNGAHAAEARMRIN